MADEPIYLYGEPGAEVLYLDPEGALEVAADNVAVPDEPPTSVLVQIEEFTSRSAASDFPSATTVIENMTEWAGGNGETTEDGYEQIEEAGGHEDVKAAFQAAIDLWASKVKYRMADTLVRTVSVQIDYDEHDVPEWKWPG